MSKLMTPIALLLSLCGLQACSADVNAAAQSWPTECVGRMQLRLPGSADVAALPFKAMQRHLREPGLVYGFTFPDGVPALLANLPAISHPLNESERAALWADAVAQKNRVTAKSERRRKEQGTTASDVAELPNNFLDASTAIGWVANNSRIVVFRPVGDSFTEWSENLSDADSILKVRPRSTFETPKEPGLCMPYVFVPDNGNMRGRLSISYRLKDHPDIQVTLTDASNLIKTNTTRMSEAEIKLRSKNAAPESQIAGYWHLVLNGARKYESQWLLPSTTKAVTLAGYEGRQSFVRLTMDDGTLNYGYYAVASGEADSAESTTDIHLHIEQDVRLAQGKTPLNKDQFIEMAQAIAKSVQRRPTAAQ